MLVRQRLRLPENRQFRSDSRQIEHASGFSVKMNWYQLESQHLELYKNSDLLFPALPLTPEGNPEGEKYELEVEEKRLVPDVKQIVF